jgi:protein gp37
MDNWPFNVWLGTTVETDRFKWRISHIQEFDTVRFVSVEPMLGPVVLREWRHVLSWVIAGGESGLKCRPMELAWARALRDECREVRIPFFLKQLGGHPNKRDDISKWPEDLRIQEVPSAGRDNGVI